METNFDKCSKAVQWTNDCTQWFLLNCKYKDFEKHSVPVTCCFSSSETNGIGSL